jgi:hypothetical protein
MSPFAGFLLFKKWGYSKNEFENIVVYTVGTAGDNVVFLPGLTAFRYSVELSLCDVEKAIPKDLSAHTS